MGCQYLVCEGGIEVYYEGMWKGDEREGPGFLVMDDPMFGKVSRDGYWKKGLEHGEFAIIHEGYNGKLSYKGSGNFKNGQLHGKYHMKYEDGRELDEFWSEGIKISDDRYQDQYL